MWIADGYNLSSMPLLYSLDGNERASIVYPNHKGNLTVDSSTRVVLSCLSSKFVLPALREHRDITVTCVGGTKFRFLNHTYDYADFICLHQLRSSILVTKQKCQPRNSTVIRIGYQTRRYFFTLYKACFDMKSKDTLYTWFYARLPYFNNVQERKRIRRFFRYKELYEYLNINKAYMKFHQVSINIHKTIFVV